MSSAVHAVVYNLVAEIISIIAKAIYERLKAKKKSGTAKNQTQSS